MPAPVSPAPPDVVVLAAETTQEGWPVVKREPRNLRQGSRTGEIAGVPDDQHSPS